MSKRDIIDEIDSVIFDNYEPQLDAMLSQIFFGYEDERFTVHGAPVRHGFRRSNLHTQECNAEFNYPCDDVEKWDLFTCHGAVKQMCCAAYLWGLQGYSLLDFMLKWDVYAYIEQWDNCPMDIKADNISPKELLDLYDQGVAEATYINWQK